MSNYAKVVGFILALMCLCTIAYFTYDSVKEVGYLEGFQEGMALASSSCKYQLSIIEERQQHLNDTLRIIEERCDLAEPREQ